MLEDLIQEGVYDPGIYKAVFLMGGPGSRKSTVVNKLALTSLGLKTINTDKAFEKGLKKAGQTLDLKTVPADVRDPIRKKAKRMTQRGLDKYIDGRLRLIFDTTSADAGKIRMYKNSLDALGYESKMIYVSASLDNAQKRNASRTRKLPPEIVQSDWDRSQKNITAMKRIFKKDFVQITNDDDIASLDKKANSLHAKIMTWSSSFPNNKVASIWKQRQLLTKKHK